MWRAVVLTLRLTVRIQLTTHAFIFYRKAVGESFGADIYAQPI
jgi:hypothetical protein